MRRLILAAAPDAAGKIRITGDDFHYLARVLRMGTGDAFRALSPDGEELLLRIVAVDRDGLRAAACGAEPDAARSSDEARRESVPRLPPVTLLQALPKAQKMDLIVRQATEAGVSLILPFIADRSVSRPETGRDCQNKRERWTRIVREARQQSGSDIATEVAEPASLATALERWRAVAPDGKKIGIFLHLDPLAQGSMHGYLSSGPNAVAIAVGPEGGFSPAEAALFTASDFRPALLGANVLRTETAAVYAIAAIQVILLEQATWMPRQPDFPASIE